MNNLELNEKSLVYYLKQYRMRKSLTFLPETTSTNDVAKDICKEKKAKGVVVVSDCQTQGKGRIGRSFCSPQGKGNYLSVAYELSGTEKNIDLISSLAGLAVRDSVYNFYNIDSKIKWPNDILVEDKKLCGILCEVISTDKPKAVIVGIGINVEKFDFPDELAYTATSIAEHYEGEIDHNELCIDIINNLDRYVIRNNIFTSNENHDIINRLKTHSASLEQMVRIITPDGEYDARVIDISLNGGLVVSTATGEKTITSGEIVHIR